MDAFHGRGEHHLHGAYRADGLNLNHNHLLEIKKYAKLEVEPMFTPAVGAFAQGMIVHLCVYHRSSLALPATRCSTPKPSSARTCSKS